MNNDKNVHKTDNLKTFTIISDDGSSKVTCVPGRGGALSSIIMPGKSGPRELLFQHDNFWDAEISDLPGGWPVAFPVFARLERQGQRGAYLWNGHIYQLPIHGFAWQEPWKIEVTASHQLTLTLTDNERTRQVYPFRFQVILEYEIQHAQLICRQTFTNLDDKPMPYNFGFHPYFLTPSHEKNQISLHYEPKRRFVYNATLTDLIGETALFSLPSSLGNPEINEQLTMLGKNKEIKLVYPDGDVIHICADGLEDADLFPYVQLYTIPEKPFFCVEPIMGFPNALNSCYGMRWLLPNQSEHGLLKVWLNY